MKTFLLPSLVVLLLSAASASAQGFYIKAQEHLTKAKALLERPTVKNETRMENALTNQLSQALSNLESGQENRGSARPAAIKAIKAAQAELAAGNDAAQRAKALEHVKIAIEKVERAIDLKR